MEFGRERHWLYEDRKICRLGVVLDLLVCSSSPLSSMLTAGMLKKVIYSGFRQGRQFFFFPTAHVEMFNFDLPDTGGGGGYLKPSRPVNTILIPL